MKKGGKKRRGKLYSSLVTQSWEFSVPEEESCVSRAAMLDSHVTAVSAIVVLLR